MAMAKSASHPDMAPSQKALMDSLLMAMDTNRRMSRKGTVVTGAEFRQAIEEYQLAGKRMLQHSTRILELLDADDRGEL